MSAAGLRGIAEFQLVRGLLRDVQAALQEAGQNGHERFVLLTGRSYSSQRATIRSAWIPMQIPRAHDVGLSVTVPGEELRRLNEVWAGKGERLMAQVHSHPTIPFHSETDDRYPIVTIEGGMSIVVPLFGFCDMSDLRSCAVFRLTDGRWQWLAPREVDRLIRLV